MAIQKAILRFDLNQDPAPPDAAIFLRGHDNRELAMRRRMFAMIAGAACLGLPSLAPMA
jgi:hypothetical protein